MTMHLRRIVLVMALTVLTGPASADTIAEWSARAVAIGAEKQLATSRSTRVLAMTHVAMFEAVNAIDRRYKPYKLDLAGDGSASRDAAAAAAAHGVLVGLFPDEQAKLDQALQASLAAIDSEARAKGIELGKKAAAGIGALRGRRQQRARKLSPVHPGRYLRPYRVASRKHQRQHETVGHGERLPVPPRGSARAQLGNLDS